MRACAPCGEGCFSPSCQNCGNRFTVDQIEIQTGGCNPVPIFPEERTQTETEILLSYERLKEAAQIFANWKTFG